MADDGGGGGGDMGGGGGGGGDHGGGGGTDFGGGGGDHGGGGGADVGGGNADHGGEGGGDLSGGGGGGGGAYAGNDDTGGLSAMAANTLDLTEMAMPIMVTTQQHDNRHDEALDRPPDLAYNEGQLNDSSPRKSAKHVANPFARQRSNLDLDDYFTGPRDIQKHSKWPMFMQMHGSILPKMVFPLFVLGVWSTMVTCVSTFTSSNLGISSILLTVTGFVVGMGLSFRSSSAYERYGEGRRYWAQLMLASQTLGRVFWIHAVERPQSKEKDMLTKLTGLNLVVAFSVALKHRLRHEPYTGYEDLVHLVNHLDTYANTATIKEPEKLQQRRPSTRKIVGEYLGLSFATSNPRKTIKRAGQPLGNLPLEILTYLACYIDEMVTNSQLVIPMHQTMAYNNMAVMNDVMMGTERVLTTPLPIAYSIAISQVTWLYVFLLPFQLYPVLHWVTIPASIVAAYIILGILFIGREIENPFGQDVNDLPLESYCAQIASDIDLITSRKKHRNRDWVESPHNLVMQPLSMAGWPVWMERGEERLREALKVKMEMSSGKSKGFGLSGEESGPNGENLHGLGHQLANVLEEGLMHGYGRDEKRAAGPGAAAAAAAAVGEKTTGSTHSAERRSGDGGSSAGDGKGGGSSSSGSGSGSGPTAQTPAAATVTFGRDIKQRSTADLSTVDEETNAGTKAARSSGGGSEAESMLDKEKQ